MPKDINELLQQEKGPIEQELKELEERYNQRKAEIESSYKEDIRARLLKIETDSYKASLKIIEEKATSELVSDKMLVLFGVGLTSLDGLEKIPNIETVETLELSSNELEKISGLGKICPKLKEIRIVGKLN